MSSVNLVSANLSFIAFPSLTLFPVLTTRRQYCINKDPQRGKIKLELAKKKEFYRERLINLRRKDTNQTFLVRIHLPAQGQNWEGYSTKEPFRGAKAAWKEKRAQSLSPFCSSVGGGHRHARACV